MRGGSGCLTNRGQDVVRNVIYSREWFQPGAEGWTFPNDIAGAPAADGVCRVQIDHDVALHRAARGWGDRKCVAL